MLKYNNIKSVHIEPTQKCQAACLQCDRNINGGIDNPYLTGSELKSQDYNTIFTEKFIQQLNHMYMCGNLGDPCVSTESIYGFEYFRFTNFNMHLSMNTNGGAQDTEWWKRLGLILGKSGHVTFSFDGLEDTNHLYRQNVNWKRCMENSSAFISSGGRARWEFIIFEHNQHQIQEAKILAKKMGFEDFRTKKTGRFFSTVKHEGKEEHQGVNRKGEQTQKLQKPKDEYINAALKKEKDIVTEYGSMDHYYDVTPIDCKSIVKSEIFVTAEGHVFPCCWLGGQQYKWYWKPKEAPIWKLIKNPNNINAKYNSLQDIVEGYFFKSIEKSWSCDSVNNGKLKVCANKCGIGFDAFKEQWN